MTNSTQPEYLITCLKTRVYHIMMITSIKQVILCIFSLFIMVATTRITKIEVYKLIIAETPPQIHRTADILI